MTLRIRRWLQAPTGTLCPPRGSPGFPAYWNLFGAAAPAKAAAWAADTWTAIGRVAARPQAAAPTALIRDRAYHLVIYRSSSRDQRKAKAFDRELARICTAADRAAATLADQAFQAAADQEATSGRGSRRGTPIPGPMGG